MGRGWTTGAGSPRFHSSARTAVRRRPRWPADQVGSSCPGSGFRSPQVHKGWCRSGAPVLGPVPPGWPTATPEASCRCGRRCRRGASSAAHLSSRLVAVAEPEQAGGGQGSPGQVVANDGHRSPCPTGPAAAGVSVSVVSVRGGGGRERVVSGALLGEFRNGGPRESRPPGFGEGDADGVAQALGAAPRCRRHS